MKKSERDFIMYLEDILQCTKKIHTWTRNMTQEEFLSDGKTQDAIIMNIGIIGEATKNLPLAIKRKYPGVSWKKMVGMRNILVHEYFGINLKKVWKTIQQDIPDIKEKISKILETELRNEKLL